MICLFFAAKLRLVMGSGRYDCSSAAAISTVSNHRRSLTMLLVLLVTDAVAWDLLPQQGKLTRRIIDSKPITATTRKRNNSSVQRPWASDSTKVFHHLMDRSREENKTLLRLYDRSNDLFFGTFTNQNFNIHDLFWFLSTQKTMMSLLETSDSNISTENGPNEENQEQFLYHDDTSHENDKDYRNDDDNDSFLRWEFVVDEDDHLYSYYECTATNGCHINDDDDECTIPHEYQVYSQSINNAASKINVLAYLGINRPPMN